MTRDVLTTDYAVVVYALNEAIESLTYTVTDMADDPHSPDYTEIVERINAMQTLLEEIT